MKFFWVAAILAAGMFGVLPSQSATFNGQYYMPLADFARASGFVALKRGDEEVLTNKTQRLVFDANSAQAQINGVNVRLSFPVALAGGELLVSELDVETALRPLILSQRASGRKITTICLDPGHGGKDTGNRVGGIFAHNEKTYTLALGLELRDQLEQAGFHVILTRSRDVFVDLPSRPALADRDHADLFISLHFNSSPVDKGAIEGPETYCITPVGAQSSNAHGEGGEFGTPVDTRSTLANRDENKSLLLAYEVEKSLVRNLNAEDRGVRRARFAVLRDAAMPAILIEGGYMTHPVESKKIYNAEYRREMASAIVKGVLAYQRLTAPLEINKVRQQ
jgi:N-acetylmuramoyl-L-alanine amidase